MYKLIMQFLTFIKTQYAKDVHFVQPNDDSEIVFFDNEGNGEIWNIEGSPFFVARLILPENRLRSGAATYIDGAFCYKDKMGNDLIIAYRQDRPFLYVFLKNHTQSKTLQMRTLMLKENVYKIFVDSGNFYLFSYIEGRKTLFKIDIVWTPERGDEFADLAEFTYDSNLENSLPHKFYNYFPKNVTFDISSVPQEFIGKVTFEDYDIINDKTVDLVKPVLFSCVYQNTYCFGHEKGVSIWQI